MISRMVKRIPLNTKESSKSAILDVEQVAFHYTRALRNYQQSPTARKGHQKDVEKEAIEFWRRVPS